MHQSPPYFFLHLHKTAGTTLLSRLRQEFDEHQIYPGPGDGTFPNSILVVDDLRARWQLRRDEIQLVTGHFPLCVTTLLDAHFSTFTVLRHPVDRVASALRDHKQRGGAESSSLADIYDDPIQQLLVRNHMVKMLSLTPDEMTDGALTDVRFTPERLERAKAALATIGVVGVQERFDAFCAELAARFDLELGPPRVTNQSKPEDLPDTLRERIIADNADDIALYEYADELAS